MDHQSPKDGFVITVLAADQAQVTRGTPILQMDTEDEDKELGRLRTMEAVRALVASQYQGDELANTLALAQNAVTLGEKTERETHTALQIAEVHVKSGTYKDIELISATYDHDKAQLTLEKARENLKKLNFAIDRQAKSNALVRAHLQDEEQRIMRRKELLTVKATVGGRLRLNLAPGVFVKLGDVLFSIS
ncbi:MAG TPA: hypothetical protein VHG32_13410 [Thermoanaerobaculia bacterium]|jgi:multidrug resistance efflux pump|nr:hypothetical protein [Thermoanaerobaculia bacterium]